MMSLGILTKLVHAGARLHQAGCGGCIGMGQAPATGRISLRTVPRNFPGRSGTKEDQVYLCSPETAAASALTGVITDPRALGMKCTHFIEPKSVLLNTEMLIPPLQENEKFGLEKGPNIKPLPQLDPLLETLKGPVLLKVGDNISTDEIMPAGAKVLPFRSNIPEISRFVFSQIDDSYYERTLDYHMQGSFIVGGANYGQGSSREHAALAPRYLGVKAVIAKGFARIHLQNLSNFGILPLVLVNPDDWKTISQDDILSISDVRNAIRKGNKIEVTNLSTDMTYETVHHMTPYQVEMVLAGSLINLVKQKGLSPDRNRLQI
jgi:aconitate hydratase